jgi:hypothetical protein
MADIQVADKKKHIAVGLCISIAATIIVYCFAPDKGSKLNLLLVFVGLFAGALAGYLKELYDKKSGFIFDKKDFEFTVIGAMIGAFLSLGILGLFIARLS